MVAVDMRRGWLLSAMLATMPVWAGDDVERLERRVQVLEQRLSSQALMEMMQQVDQLQREVQSLRGQVETLENTLSRVRESQKQQYLDLDGRLRRLEGGQAASSDTPLAAEAPPEPPREAVPPKVQPQQRVETPVAVQLGIELEPPGEEAKKEYRRAYDKLQAGHFDAAIQAFTGFLQHHPATTLSANAYYWLGEAYYVKRDFNAAGDAFRQVIEHYPASLKVPDALLKLGYVAYEQHQWKAAREFLEEVQRRFPDSRAAQLAAERLERMQQEGRI